MARILANEMGVDIKSSAGPVIERQADLSAILTSLEEFDFLFLDEVDQGLDANSMELLIQLINEKRDEIGTILLVTHRKEMGDLVVDQKWRTETIDNITSKLVINK